MLVPIITFILILKAIRQDINYGLPHYVRSKNLGIFSLIYTLMRIVAPMLIFISLPTFSKSWWLFVIGLLLYGCAYVVKIIVWQIAYGFKPKFNLLT